jgi:hypothetical protein
MSGVSKIMNRVVDFGIKKPLNAFSNNLCKNYQSNNTKYIAALGLTSIVLKDSYGCYLYVKQSLNNEKIPDDKRKFVAALDLTNGGLMVLSQIAMFFTISNSKVQAKLFDKIFGKKFDGVAKKACEAAIKKTPKFSGITAKEFETTYGKFKGEIKGFFGIFTSLVAATILAKRVLVPFIATPLADKAKELMCKDENNDKDTFAHPTSLDADFQGKFKMANH